MTLQTRVVATTALIFAATATSAAERMLFVPVTPCRAVDTRQSTAGRLAAGEIRSFDVLGDGNFVGQGGPSGGCGLPGFQSGERRIRAVIINLVAVEPAGPGHLKAWAADSQPPTTSVVNYLGAPDPGNVANEIMLGVRQDPSVSGDIKVQAAVSSVHLVADVVGYLAPLVRTVVVSPVPNDPPASGNALLAAMASIPSASASDPWLVKLEPGVYDLGGQFLALREHVDVEGSGREVTRITADGADELNRGTVMGAEHAGLRSLTVENRGGGRNFATAIYNGGVSPTLWDLHVLASDRNPIGIHNVDSAARVTNVDVGVVAASGYAYSVWNESPTSNTDPPAATFVDVIAQAEGQAYNYGFYNSNTSPSLTRVSATARGGANTALYNSWNTSPVVRDSSFTAENGNGFNIAINSASNIAMVLKNVDATARGAYSCTAISTNGGRLTVEHLTATADCSAGTSVGFLNCSADVHVRDSRVSASGGDQSYGFWNECFPGGEVEIHSSVVAGGTGSLLNLASTYSALVGTSQLIGPVDNRNGSESKCVASYDQDFDSLAPACSP